MSGMTLAALCWVVALMLAIVGRVCSAGAAERRVEVDFQTRIDPPLVKKFGMMNSGMVSMGRHRRDVPKLAILGAQSLRIDLSIGKDVGWDEQVVAGSASELKYNWGEIDELSRSLNQIGVLPYWSFCYTPRPLQGKEGWRGPPTDMGRWAEAAEAFARHFRESGIRIGYHEVWNEPDFGEFFRGTREEFFEMYKAAAVGMRRGNADATIGGPGLAFSSWWAGPFVRFVEKNEIPLDFISFHSIGGGEGDPAREVVAGNWLKTVREVLGSKAYFQTTEMHLGEYHPYYGKTAGLTGGYALAGKALDNVSMFLDWTDLTVVSWAQYMDAGQFDSYGLVSVEGEPKAAFGAFAIYGDMPVERVKADGTGPVKCMASADQSKACVVIWNRSTDEQQMGVSLGNVPFRKARLGVYRIDAGHSVIARQNGRIALQPVETKGVVVDTPVRWEGTIPGQAVVYLKLDNIEAKAMARAAPPGRIVKVHHYFPRRGTGQYAYFDEGSWSAILGMGSEARAVAVVGVTVEKARPTLGIRFDKSGQLKVSEEASLGVRVDYEGDGGYSRSVLLYDQMLGGMKTAALPWGTKRAAERVVKVDDLGDVQLELATYAPPRWTGRVIISLVMRDTGPNTRVRAFLTEGR